tara:strand:- start:262 stop:888 length:627 start_codon:yes stop_codon:yes gene_type:complete
MTDQAKNKGRPNASKGRPVQKKSSNKNNSFQDQEINRMLVSGEEIILRARLHNAIYWKSVAILLVSILFWVFIAHPLGVLFFITGAFMLCAAIMTQHYLILVVTNKRVLARYGLLQMDVVDIRLSMIESIDLERMLPGHILGYANVVVMGTGNRMIRVPYIGNAESFRRYYNEMVLASEGDDEALETVKAQKVVAEKEDQQNKSPNRR